MPRPKGSKNKPKVVKAAAAVVNFEEQIAAVEAEIKELNTAIKAKKVVLKKLEKQKAAADKAAQERKAEEERETLIAAVNKSGKSFEEILEFLK